MKKLILLLFFIIPFLTACTANVIGKFDDYNEIFTGTIDLDMKGNGIIKVKTIPSNITCKGRGWLTYTPASSFGCKGQRGEAKLSCSDGRKVSGDWVCEACTRINGDGITNFNENITFYISTNDKRINKKIEEYKQDTEGKPNLNSKKSTKESILEDLF